MVLRDITFRHKKQKYQLDERVLNRLITEINACFVHVMYNKTTELRAKFYIFLTELGIYLSKN